MKPDPGAGITASYEEYCTPNWAVLRSSTGGVDIIQVAPRRTILGVGHRERIVSLKSVPVALLCVCCASALGVLPAPADAVTQISGLAISNISIYYGNGGPTSQGAVITFTSGISGLEGCGNTAGNAIWIDFSSTTAQPDGKALYATVLAAQTAGQVLTFGVNGCADSNQLPLVYRVDVHF
jgi:hypothetical protein